jgi:hypothetical protein
MDKQPRPLWPWIVATVVALPLLYVAAMSIWWALVLYLPGF